MELKPLVADLVGQKEGTVGITSGKVGIAKVGVDDSSLQVADEVVGGLSQPFGQLFTTLKEKLVVGIRLLGGVRVCGLVRVHGQWSDTLVWPRGKTGKKEGWNGLGEYGGEVDRHGPRQPRAYQWGPVLVLVCLQAVSGICFDMGDVGLPILCLPSVSRREVMG